jgi:uncharacterized RDD family membrane protein YckC
MSLPEETLDIQTPENVAFGYQVAGIGSRFLATLLDTLLIGILQVVVILVFILVLSGFDLWGETVAAWVYALLGIVGFLFFWGYYIFFEMLWNGQSPGKRWVGLRVIRRDGTPITLSESFIRNLTRFVDFLPAGYGIGIISMFLDKQSRRLGDLAAGTLVVHDRAPISIQSLSARRTANLSIQGHKQIPLDGFPLERLTNDDLALIEDFLLRREQLTHRETLANQILNTLHTRLGLSTPSLNRNDAEEMLLTILYTVRRRAADEYWRNRDNQSKSTSHQ